MPPSARFLLDESLDSAVAEALNAVEYRFDLLPKGTQDPEIIEWRRANGAVWVHADDSAWREHGPLLQTSGIRTIWIRRKKGGMNGMEQLRILSFILPRFLKAMVERPARRHYMTFAENDLSVPGFRPV